VAVKDALAHRVRLLATATGIVLGVAFLAGSLVLTDTIRRTFDDLFAEVNAGRDAVVRSALAVEGTFEDDRRGRLDAAVVDAVRGVDGVAHAEGEVGGFAQIVGRDGDPLGMPGQGPPTLGVSWPERDALNPLVLLEGRAPRGRNEVVVDKRSADVGDLVVGGPVTVLTKHGPAGLRLVGVARFGDADSPGGASIVALAPATAQRLIAEPGKFDQIAVVADEGVSQDALVRRLSGILPEGVEALRGGEFIREQQGEIREGVDFFEVFLLAFAGVGLFVGGFAVNNTFSIIGAQRIRETALLRALGASRRQVLVSLVVEAVLLGAVATALGIAAGFAVAAGLKALLAGFGVDVPAAGLVFRSRTAVAAVSVGMGVSVVSAFVPAWRASRVPPLAVIRDVAVDVSGRSGVRLAVGGAFFGLGGLVLALGVAGAGAGPVGFGGALVFVGLAILGAVLVRPLGATLAAPVPRLRGVVGALARENLVRNPRRTSTTAAALMVGVGVVATITVLAESISSSVRDVVDDNVRADVVIDSTSVGSGIAPALGDRLAARPEVGAVVPVRHELVRVEGRGEDIVGLPAASAPEVVNVGRGEARLAGLGLGEMSVHEDTAGDRGWEVGDRVEVTFADTGPQRLRIVNVHDEGFIVGAFVVDLSTFEANVADQFDSQVLVTAGPGVTADAALAVVESLAAGYPNTEVRDLAAFREFQASQLDQLLGLVYSLLGLAIVIALFGIGNALSLSVLERTRELGLLRAVGMTRRQLRSSVRWEAVLVALFGTTLGLAVGLVFAWALTRVADGLAYRVPVGQVAVIAAVATFAGVLAAIVPARRAARLDVLDAVTYE
jgi:putative ABC transport system permease protein